MGIYGALSSAVTGLRAQAHALENISGNIANSQTTGYKRIETDFLDLIPDAPAVLGHVEPAPDASDDGAHEGRHQYSRSLVHVPLLNADWPYSSAAIGMNIKARADFVMVEPAHGCGGGPDRLPSADGCTNIASATPFHSWPPGLPGASEPIGMIAT